MNAEQQHICTRIMEDLLSSMGISGKVTVEKIEETAVSIGITSPDSYLLIGHFGKNLHALQVLAQNIAYRKLKDGSRLHLDIDDYLKKRHWYLKDVAKKAAQEALHTRKEVALEPMPNYERKLIHTFLDETFEDITTMSVGEEPNRRLVISAK
jgi:spoIIIJ-associated protein